MDLDLKELNPLISGICRLDRGFSRSLNRSRIPKLKKIPGPGSGIKNFETGAESEKVTAATSDASKGTAIRDGDKVG